MGLNVAFQFPSPYERSSFTQKENSLRVSAWMFFQPVALSPSLRSMCFSGLSDLPSCPICVFPSSSSPRSLLQPAQPHLSFVQQVLVKVHIKNYWWFFFMGVSVLSSFFSILLLKKKAKYKRFLEHSKSYPHISLQDYFALQNQLEKSIITVKVLKQIWKADSQSSGVSSFSSDKRK